MTFELDEQVNPSIMFLENLIQPKNLIFDLCSHNKQEAITSLVNLINKNHHLIDTPEKWVREFMKREKKGSTGLQNGIAVPHIKTSDINAFYLAIGIHHQGMNFKSIDGKPTHIIFLLIAPLTEIQTHLHLLSMISRLFLKKDFTQKVLQKESPEKLCHFFKEIFYE